ncbi:hypothetical protein [Bartonella sp. CB189]|uniref:hypothetical protein n=1 Tax=Bartonella sp. CB189 TaxID=3112254 RepID=UPI002F96E2AE
MAGTINYETIKNSVERDDSSPSLLDSCFDPITHISLSLIGDVGCYAQAELLYIVIENR